MTRRSSAPPRRYRRRLAVQVRLWRRAIRSLSASQPLAARALYVRLKRD